MKQGALATLSEKDLGEQPYPYIQVKSSLTAVKDIAEYYLKQLSIPVVGITGSVGKDQHKGNDCSRSFSEIQYTEDPGEF